MNRSYSQIPPSQTSTAAIISLITGILGFAQVLPIIGPIIAVISGHIAKSEIKNSGGVVTGNGMATAGLVLGYVTLAMGICLGCIVLLVFAGVITLPFTIPFLNPSNHFSY
jgi:dihydroorotate dehydrogenase